MKDRPILFSAPMVRAILDGSKTQTRRVVKSRHEFEVFRADGANWPHLMPYSEMIEAPPMPCPYGQPGDRLWVRETHFINDFRGAAVPLHERQSCEILYRATDEDYVRNCEDSEGLRWTPSIHMPRWASRILLEITGVRVERLQDISQADARAEGAPPSHPSIDAVSREFGYSDFPRSWYAQLWEHINGAGSWATNPWVWVIEFRRLDGREVQQ